VRRIVPLTLVAAVALGAAACTSQDDRRVRDDAAGKADEAKATAIATPPPPFAGAEHKLPKGKALRNDPDLYKAVALTGCERSADGWRATGTIKTDTGTAGDTGEGGASRGVSILVLFTDAQARAIDSARTTVDVTAGETTDWTAAKAFSAPAEVDCVVRAVRRAS
jgi:hypothetical protein